jgi:uncharacterized iron-regulated protein
MKFLSSLFLFFFTIQVASAQNPHAYLVLQNDGSISNFETLSISAGQHAVVLFGELHNNPISHWLQMELAHRLNADTTSHLVIGLEMFEADNQVLIDEYLGGLITTRNFEQEVRLWTNYKTDIKPLVEFAKNEKLRLVATNIPRRYASMVYSGGLESLNGLSDEAKKWIAPLPIIVDLELPGYKNISEMAHGHGGENLPKSQAVKDATMAHFILQNMKVDTRFLHIHGTYHSDNYEGIFWYLKQSEPGINILTIATVEVDSMDEPFDEAVYSKADFTIVVPKSMTKTH